MMARLQSPTASTKLLAATFDDYAFDDSEEEEEVEKIDQNFVDSESDEDTGEDEKDEVVEEPKKVVKKPRKVTKK